MIVAYRDGSPVRLRDIAEVEDGLSDFRQLARFNGVTAVGLGIVKIPNTNTVEIIRARPGTAGERHHPGAAAGHDARPRAERLGLHQGDHQLR